MTWYASEYEVDWWRKKAQDEYFDTPSKERRRALVKAIAHSRDRKHSAEKRIFMLKDALASGGLLPTEAEVIG